MKQSNSHSDLTLETQQMLSLQSESFTFLTEDVRGIVYSYVYINEIVNIISNLSKTERNFLIRLFKNLQSRILYVDFDAIEIEDEEAFIKQFKYCFEVLSGLEL